MEKINEYSTLINEFMCIHDVLLELDTALPHSLHSKCFLNSSFLSKARSTCGNSGMAHSFIYQTSSTKCSYNNTVYQGWPTRPVSGAARYGATIGKSHEGA
jgi:hypothetical protein